MSKKSAGPKKPYGNGGGGATASAVKFGVGLRAGIRDTEVLIRLDDPGYVAALWTDVELKEALELLGEAQRTAVHVNLERIADFCKRLVKVAEKLEQRDADALKMLTRDDEVRARELELDNRGADLSKLEAGVSAKSLLIERREADADAGFSKQRAAADEEIRLFREAFKQQCDDKLAKLLLAGEASLAVQRGRVNDSEATVTAREAAVDEKEAEQRRIEESIAARKRRLDRQEESLDAAREEALTSARAIAQDEVDAERQRRENAEAKALRASSECMKALADLAQFDELKRVLGERKPEGLLVELQALRARCETLQDEVLARPEVGSGDASTLRKEKEALQLLLNNLQPELERAKIELSKTRIGAVEREGLEKQKFALEKTNQALATKLNQLGETVDKLSEVGQVKSSFPELVRMDTDAQFQRVPRLDEVGDLRKFADDLQQRIAAAEPDVPLYYQIRDIRLLIAGLATSQLQIFQGISGTGKTSLAKALAKAVGGHCEDIAVQAGWRDKDDLLGHYNPFDKRYAEKPFLKGLYKAQTPRYSNTINIVLLDEMNLSHPEQYFADFLSAMEKNALDDRVIELYESRLPNPPALLINGHAVRLPENVWFIGTANHDETTKTFADKTFDRAHVMTLPRHEAKFQLRELPRRQGVSWNSLRESFDSVRLKRRLDVDKLLDELNTGPLIKILESQFRIGLGNRFDRQAHSFLPVFEAVGGSMSIALDFLLASRVFRTGKVTGRYDVARSSLEAAKKALTDTWRQIGGEPSECLSSLEVDLQTKAKS